MHHRGFSINNISFHWYVGQVLASLLPYRKKRLIFGPQVCEWPAVMYMAKAGFFVGCSLSLANKPAGEEVLTEAAAPQPWKDAFGEGIGYLERGRKKGAATFEDFYPESTSNAFKHIALTAEECVVRVGQWVVPGLMLGILFPETALSMLKAWVTQRKEWKDLGRGLRVDASPLLTSVEEAYTRAQTIYEEWRRQQQ